MIRTVFIGTMLLMVLTVKGQTLTGKIVTTDNIPINHASVCLKNDNSIVAFGFSDKQGHFSFDAKGKTYSEVEVRQMGYATQRILRENYLNGQTIKLTEQPQELKEVVVKSQKIRQEGDTLNFLVSAFRDKQDRVIADVIRKIPGLTVNSDGTIEYQGQLINKFYIEGMDLLGNRYAQASENIDAGKVKKVQVLERHQPIRALRNVDFSEQAALNIVLADSSKNVWNHTAEVSTGAALNGENDWLYDGRLMSMLFARKAQSISMYKANNTGKDIAQEITPSGYLADTAPTDDGILENISLPAPDLREQRSHFNESHLMATNWLFKTRAGNDIRLQLNGITDRSKQRQSLSVVYTAADGAVTIQDVSAISHHDAFSAEMLYKQNTDRQYLTNNVSGYIDFDRSNGLSVLNGRETRESVKPRQRYVSDKLSFVRNIDSRHTLSANAYISLNELPGQLLLTDSTTERLRQRSLLGGFDAHFGDKVGAVYLHYNVGTDFKTQRLHIQHTTTDTRQGYQEWRSFVTPSLSYKSSIIDLKASLTVYLTNRTYESQHKSNVTLEPNVFFRLLPASSLSATLSYDYSWHPEGLLRLLNVPVFSDYITMTRGTGRLDETMTHRLKANVEYKDVARGFFASAGYLFANNRHQRLYARRIVSGVYESYATDQTANSTAHGINGRVSVGWNGAAGFVTSLSAASHWSNYDMLLNGEARAFLMQTAMLTATVSANPLDWLGIEHRSSYHYTRQHCKAIGYAESSLCSFSHQTKCYLMPGQFQIEWNNEICHCNDESVSFTYFADLAIYYRTKRYEIGLSCSNIFGKTDYERRQITDIQQIYTVTRLRPMEVLFKMEFYL